MCDFSSSSLVPLLAKHSKEVILINLENIEDILAEYPLNFKPEWNLIFCVIF